MVALAWESTRNEGRPMIKIKVWLRIYTETGWVFLRSALLRVRSLLYRLTQCKHVLTHRIEYLGDGEVIGQVREFLVILFLFLFFIFVFRVALRIVNFFSEVGAKSRLNYKIKRCNYRITWYQIFFILWTVV